MRECPECLGSGEDCDTCDGTGEVQLEDIHAIVKDIEFVKASMKR